MKMEKVQAKISRLRAFQVSKISPKNPHRCKVRAEVSQPPMKKVTKAKKWYGTYKICKTRLMRRKSKLQSSFLASTWLTSSKRRRKVDDCTIQTE